MRFWQLSSGVQYMKLNDHEVKHLEYIYSHLGECIVLLKKNNDFPLKEAGNIALYGSGARQTIKGGTGSGEVNKKTDERRLHQNNKEKC